MQTPSRSSRLCLPRSIFTQPAQFTQLNPHFPLFNRGETNLLLMFNRGFAEDKRSEFNCGGSKFLSSGRWYWGSNTTQPPAALKTQSTQRKTL